MTLQTLDLSYFLGKSLFGDASFQNMFVYQPTLDTLELKKEQVYWLCSHMQIKEKKKKKNCIKLSSYRMGITKNYANEIVNDYISYDLGAWRKVPFNNFKLKNAFFVYWGFYIQNICYKSNNNQNI